MSLKLMRMVYVEYAQNWRISFLCQLRRKMEIEPKRNIAIFAAFIHSLPLICTYANLAKARAICGHGSSRWNCFLFFVNMLYVAPWFFRMENISRHCVHKWCWFWRGKPVFKENNLQMQIQRCLKAVSHFTHKHNDRKIVHQVIIVVCGRTAQCQSRQTIQNAAIWNMTISWNCAIYTLCVCVGAPHTFSDAIIASMQCNLLRTRWTHSVSVVYKYTRLSLRSTPCRLSVCRGLAQMCVYTD